MASLATQIDGNRPKQAILSAEWADFSDEESAIRFDLPQIPIGLSRTIHHWHIRRRRWERWTALGRQAPVQY